MNLLTQTATKFEKAVIYGIYGSVSLVNLFYFSIYSASSSSLFRFTMLLLGISAFTVTVMRCGVWSPVELDRY